MGYFYYLWYLLGYADDDEDDKPIMCINSFAPTSRGINYVMKRIYFDDDEDHDYDTEDEAERYFKKNYD